MGKPSTAKQKFKQLAYALLVTLFIVSSSAQEDLIFIGRMSNKYDIATSGTKYFKIRVGQDNSDGEQDLIVKVIEGDISSDPDVYISKINPKPDNWENSEWACSSYGKDTCAVNHENVTNGDIFYIGVRCNTKCSFKIFPSLTREIELQDGEEVQMDFTENESKIFKIKIPSNSAQDDDNKIKSLVITAAPFLPGTKDLTLSASTQKRVTASTSTLKGVPAWSKGQAIRLSENAGEWCTDCTITIMVDVEEAGRYSVKAKSNSGIPKLYTEKKVDDVAYFGDQQCYTYYVKEAKKDLQIRVTQYSGMISLLVNAGAKPKSTNESQFPMTGSQSFLVTLTAVQRSRDSQKTGQFYICLYPHLTSSYSLMVTEVDPNLDYKIIEDGFVENGEVNGKKMMVYLYKVPPLEYSQEDINVNFQLQTISGTRPFLAVSFCQEENFKKCAESIQRQYVLDVTGTYQKATVQNNNLYLEYDHQEQECDKYKGGCYYTVVVVGNAEGDNNYTRYDLSVTHTQQNYIIIGENSYLSDYVNTGVYKYYKFTLLDDSNVRNVSFIMNTMHGDADLFISRKHKQPNKFDEFEKSSQRSYGVIDFVYFDEGDLVTTYYIGVHGYQYSTFTLQAKVDRGNNDYNHVPLLLEGVPTKGYITDKLAHDNFRFEVKMAEGYEKSIKIQASPFEGRVKMYVKFGSQPTKDDFQYQTGDNLIVINTNDYNYHREGTYYVAVYPEFTFWEFFTQNNFGYMLSFTSEQQFSYLQSNMPLEVNQDQSDNYYFRHFIQEVSDDVKLSMTTISGSPQIYIGLSPSKKWPNKDNQDAQKEGGSVSQGRSYVFTTQQLKQANPACINDGKSFAEACAIYIGVHCEGGCKYTLKVSYDDSKPHQLSYGMPQHDSVDSGEYTYYFINVKKDKQKDIYAVLNTLTGNADIFVKFEPSPSTNDIREWKLPKINDHVLKSTETLAQDVIRIRPSDLEQCFKAKGNDEKECAIVIGVYGAQPLNQKPSLSRYNIVAYADVAILINNSPISNTVDEGQYHYYIYSAHCDNCTIIASLSTFGSGDPDLYIRVGDSRLPTKSDYDISSATYKSESIEIDLTHKYFTANKIKSLKGTYIIGVYGSKNSTYTLSVTQEEHPFVVIQDGLSVKRQQGMYDTAFFKWHNWQEKDIKISLDVKHGLADIYISTFDENDVTQNFVEKIPNTKKHTKWTVESVQSTTSLDDRSLLIKSQERNYCVYCYFLIGIITHEKDTEYVLRLDNLNADFKNNQYLRIGEVYTDILKKGEKKTYKFMVDEKSPIKVQYTTVKGETDFKIRLTDNDGDQIHHGYDTGVFNIQTDNADFQSAKMYYMPAENRGDALAEFTILVTTERSIISLSEGVPLKLTYDGPNDMSKYMVFSVPQGNSTIQIQVKSKKIGFFPTLYYKFFDDIDSSLNSIQFPPGGDQFIRLRNWDEHLGLMTFQREFKNVKGNKAGLAMNLFDNYAERNHDEAVVTASYSSIQTMLVDTWLLGSIRNENSFLIYKVENSQLKKTKGSMIVEFAECIGESSVKFLKNPDQISTSNDIIKFSVDKNFGKTYYFIDLPQDLVYIQVQPEIFAQSKSGRSEKTEFLIKASFTDVKDTANNIYNLPGKGEIEYEMMSTNSFNISWGALQYIKAEEQWKTFGTNFSKGEVLYHVIETKELRAKLNTICALRKEMITEYGYRVFQSADPFYVLSYDKGGQSFQFNVIAQITQPNKPDGDLVPYKPVLVQMTSSTQALFKNIAFWFFIIVALGCSFSAAYYYFKKTKIISKQIEYEMADVRNQSTMNSYEAPEEFKNLV